MQNSRNRIMSPTTNTSDVRPFILSLWQPVHDELSEYVGRGLQVAAGSADDSDVGRAPRIRRRTRAPSAGNVPARARGCRGRRASGRAPAGILPDVVHLVLRLHHQAHGPGLLDEERIGCPGEVDVGGGDGADEDGEPAVREHVGDLLMVSPDDEGAWSDIRARSGRPEERGGGHLVRL